VGSTKYNFAAELAAGTFAYTAGGVKNADPVTLTTLPGQGIL